MWVFTPKRNFKPYFVYEYAKTGLILCIDGYYKFFENKKIGDNLSHLCHPCSTKTLNKTKRFN